MESKEKNRPEKKEVTKRFKIMRVEKRIAPASLVHVHGHVHVKV